MAADVSVRAPVVEILATPATNHADLLTFSVDGIPQLAILREKSGNANSGGKDNYRFRQVWMLTYARPSWKQRMASAIPFFYHRAGKNAGSAGAPRPILDLSDPAKGTVPRVAEKLIQISLFNSYGMLLRAPTRAYLGNALDSRNMALIRALDIVDQGIASDSTSANPDQASPERGDWNEVRGRLLLAPRLLGGYVSGERAEHAASEDRTRSLENRAANWDLLRQSAEANGLYAQPLAGSPAVPRFGVLWMAQRENRPATFHPGLLGISNPFQNPRLQNWNGYTAGWSLDDDGAVLNADAVGEALTPMIPLAVYALDYPRLPLLLVDFHSERARRRELIRRTADDVTSGIFGLTPYSSVSWFAARTGYLWVRDRHGAALNRSLRLASYARLQQAMLDNKSRWDPEFHHLLESKLDAIALNPLEQGSSSEAELAKRQYAGLLRWIDDPAGLAATLNKRRAAEAVRDQQLADSVPPTQSRSAQPLSVQPPSGSPRSSLVSNGAGR